jgi:hypothetical protein
VDPDLIIVEVSRSHSDIPQSVELWTGDQSITETSARQHTTLTRVRHPCPRWDSNPQSQHTKRLQWSSGSLLAFGTQVRGFKPGRNRRIFRAKKILSTPSFGGEVKPSVPCRALRHVKEPKSDVEVVSFGKILSHFSPIVPPSAAGFSSVASDPGGLLWRKLERSKPLVLLQAGGWT